MTTELVILHFNDVYNVEGYQNEPKAGAARFCTALRTARIGKQSLTLFSGDCFGPSMISTITQGDHMPEILNELGIDIAVYGNHDFDFGVDKLLQCVEKTNFNWLNSNVYDSLTDELFANGKKYEIFEKCGVKIGIIGLIEPDWVATLATVDPNDVIVNDFCESGKELSNHLRNEKGCNLIIALTHMRWPNDRLLLNNVPTIDLVLGGHDHDFEIEFSNENKRLLLKSGTDFRTIGQIKIILNDADKTITNIEVEKMIIDGSIEEDPKVKDLVKAAVEELEGRMQLKIGKLSVDLDARFSSIRSQETNIGNFICDIILTAVDAEIALINSGTLRTDGIIPKGDITYRDLMNLLPIMDPLMVLSVNGSQLIEVLENGVSQYPKLEGRFPLVSGVEFKYYSSRPPGSRIDVDSIRVQKEPLELERNYRLCTKQYLANGKDGFNVLATCPVLVDDENAPVLNVAIQNYLRAVQVINGFKNQKYRYRPSVVSMYQRKSIVLENIGVNLKNLKSARNPWNKIRDKITVTEKEMCAIAPKVEGRIIRID